MSFLARNHSPPSRPVANRAGTKVPGVEMSRDHDDLFGMLTALQSGNYVVAGPIRELLRSEREVYANFPLCRQMRDQFRVFCRDRAGGNPGGKIESGGRKPEVGTA